MGMIRRADLEGSAKNALVMDLDDLRVRGEAYVREANARAEKLVRDAEAERARLIAGARDEGYRAGLAAGRAEGHAAGLEQGVAEARAAHESIISTVSAAWTAALDAYETERDSLLSAARTEIVALAAEIATRVTRRSVELDPAAVLPQIEAVLGAVVRPTRLVVRVHPDDLEITRAELPEIIARFDLCRHAELHTDASLERGSCVATTEEGGRIDADIGAQIDRIVSAMLPAEAAIRIGREARGDAA